MNKFLLLLAPAFAQIAVGEEWSKQTLAKYGIVGGIALLLLFRDFRRSDAQDKREEARVAADEARVIRQEQAMQRLLEAVQSLTHAISIDMMTRPGAVERARIEAQQLIEGTKK